MAYKGVQCVYISLYTLIMEAYNSNFMLVQVFFPQHNMRIIHLRCSPTYLYTHYVAMWRWATKFWFNSTGPASLNCLLFKWSNSWSRNPLYIIYHIYATYGSIPSPTAQYQWYQCIHMLKWLRLNMTAPPHDCICISYIYNMYIYLWFT